jgi:amidase
LLIATEAPNQDHMTEAYSQNASSDKYQRHLAHFRDVAKNQALDRVFAEYKVNIVLAPADSFLTCLASGSGS